MLFKGKYFLDEPIDVAFPASRSAGVKRKPHGTSRDSAKHFNSKCSDGRRSSDEKYPALPQALPYPDQECLHEQMAIWRRRKHTVNPTNHQSNPAVRNSVRSESPTVHKPAKRSRIFRFIRRNPRRSKNAEAAELPQATNVNTQQSVPEAAPDPAPTRPSTAPNIIRRISSTISKKSRSVEAQPPPLGEIPEASPAYIPKHAASDFSQVKVPSKSSSVDEARDISTAQSSPPESFTMPSTSCGPADESNDYQVFLAQARIAAEQKIIIGVPTNANEPQTTNIMTPVYPKQPHTKQIMNNIYANHQENQLKRTKSTPQRTKSQRATGGGAVLDKVGEYIRPSTVKQMHRPGESNSTSIKSDGQDNLPGLGFSAVGDTIRRSLSTKRSHTNRPRTGSEAGERSARSRAMPPVAEGQKLQEQHVLGGY